MLCLKTLCYDRKPFCLVRLAEYIATSLFYFNGLSYSYIQLWNLRIFNGREVRIEILSRG